MCVLRQASGEPAAGFGDVAVCAPEAAEGRNCSKRILDAIERTPDAEVTVECNPDSVDSEKFDTYRAAGVNRVSLGVQSLAPHVLRDLGRTHDPANVRRAVDLVRSAGIPTFNLDLIYGAAGETLDDWRRG